MTKMLRRFASDAIIRGRDANRLMDTILGNEGGRFKLWGDDGEELDLLTGLSVSSNNYPMDIRSDNGTHERVRHSADTHDVWKVLDAGVTIQGTAGITGAVTITGNTAVTGTFGVTGNTTLTGTLGVSGLGTFNAGLTLAGGVLTVPAGTAGAPSIAVGEATTGLFRQAAGVLGVTVSGAERARISATDLQLTGLTATLDNTQSYRILDSGGTARALATLTAVDTVTLGYAAAVQTDVDGVIVRVRSGTTTRIRVDGTGIGFFATLPVAQPAAGAAATDPASTQTLANSLRTGLRALGLFS